MSPTVWRLRFTATAARHAETIEGWWSENRADAKGLFSEELTQALERISHRPGVGVPYGDEVVPRLRRALLRATRYHVYYSVDAPERMVTIHAVWHAQRGRGPLLE